MQEKINEVIRSIQYLLPNVEVITQQVSKNNDIIKTGVMLKSRDNNIAPVFYIDDLIERGWNADEIAVYICKSYQKNDGEELQYVTALMTDYERISEMFIVQLINRKMNESVLMDIPYMPFLEDLAVIVLVDLEKNLRKCATIKVTNRMLELWNVSFEEVYHKAYLNLTKEQAVVKSIAEILSDMGCDDVDGLENIPMYIMTNETKVHGATMILRESLLQDLTRKFDSDLMILPSSLHEVIIVPTKSLFPFSEREMNKMVQEVNQTQVDDIDILSDHVYLYKEKSGWYNLN